MYLCYGDHLVGFICIPLFNNKAIQSALQTEKHLKQKKIFRDLKKNKWKMKDIRNRRLRAKGQHRQ